MEDPEESSLTRDLLQYLPDSTHATGFDIVQKHLSKIIAAVVFLSLASIALIRVSPEQLPEVVSAIFKSSAIGASGWIAALLIFLVSRFIVYFIQVTHTKEIERLTKERDYLQEKLIGSPVKHSEQESN